MAKVELGLKRTCVACGAKFYDLMRSPAACPKCGTEQPAEQPRFRRPGGAEDRAKPKRVAAAPALEEAEIEVEVEEADDDAVIEDADDLEGEDDLGAEIEVEPGSDEEER
ncbi:TIGR02300 family protein [Elioraea sp.]|uniref:TIGR02300 family protein n=1 Tax=Elioraea sp. TaxID=2185103 RepID=UPI003F70DB0E